MPLKSLKFSSYFPAATKLCFQFWKVVGLPLKNTTTTDFSVGSAISVWDRFLGLGSMGWFWVNIYLCKCMACFPRQFFQWRWHHCILVRQLGFSGLGLGSYHLVLVVWRHSKDHSCSSLKLLNFSRLIKVTRTVDGISEVVNGRGGQIPKIFLNCVFWEFRIQTWQSAINIEFRPYYAPNTPNFKNTVTSNDPKYSK